MVFISSLTKVGQRQGRVSDCRNRTMQQMFLMIGLGERAGSGMSRILHGWQALGHTVRLAERYEPQEHSVLEMGWASAVLSPPSSGESSGETAARVLSLLSKNAKLTVPNMAQHLGLTTRAVEKQLAKLKEEGRLRRVGPNKGGHWQILEP